MKTPSYIPATLNDLRTAKAVYHIHPYYPNVQSQLTLNYEGLSDMQIKALKDEVFEYWKSGKIYIKE